MDGAGWNDLYHPRGEGYFLQLKSVSRILIAENTPPPHLPYGKDRTGMKTVLLVSRCDNPVTAHVPADPDALHYDQRSSLKRRDTGDPLHARSLEKLKTGLRREPQSALQSQKAVSAHL